MKLLAALSVVACLGITSAAQAMSVSPIKNQMPSTVTQIGWRCGPGWHVNPWGRCVPRRRFYGPRWHRGWHRGWRHRHWRHW
ncbi:MAG: hypothetical protein EKK36_09675 [Bradyrhizobiaceae bacterium]|nr:MAG: hypothetical protein EKK36_09675 [Bradyrhizobiaceae bacterium]